MSDTTSPGRPRQDGSTTMAETVSGTAAHGAEVVGEQASQVAGTAKEQASQVVQEAGQQAQHLAEELRGQIKEQARTQNQRLADNVRALAGELKQMGGHGQEGSIATTAVRQLADRGHQVADHLEQRGPEGLMSEVQDFARRRPGMFLAGATLAGFLVGRTGKGVSAAGDADGEDSQASAGAPANRTGPPAGPAGSGAPATVGLPEHDLETDTGGSSGLPPSMPVVAGQGQQTGGRRYGSEAGE